MAQCVITGTLVNVVGTPMAHAVVGVRADVPANGVVFDEDGQAVGDGERIDLTDENGYFEISLVRGLHIVIRIEALNLFRQVTVPDQATVTLEELINAHV